MKFVNEHELLAYLVDLADTEEGQSCLFSGQQLAFRLQTDGLFDQQRPEQEYPLLGRLLWRLKEDGLISFIDRAAETPVGRTRYPGFLAFTLDDVWKFEDIVIKGEGRVVASAIRRNDPRRGPRVLDTGAGVLVAGVTATDAEVSAMERYLKLTDELGSCRYFVEEEQSFSFTADHGVTTSWKQTLPSAGATRDMLGVLRQLFGDGERASFASIATIVRRLITDETEAGAFVLRQVDTFERAKQGILDSWDAEPGGAEKSPRTPLDTFLDWMYGEFLHSDADKAARIKELDTDFRLYEWQFHVVVERLSVLFSQFAAIVRGVLVKLDSH